MSTALTRATDIYSKIDNPLAFIDQMGKSFHQSQIMGVSTPGDGAVLALTCMCEGITPLEFAKTYHIINGRPSMRADMMSAKFRQAGGKVKWINLGDDGKAAEAEFTFDGQSLPIKYTIEDARAVVGDKLDKPDSNWKKDRGAMLRARLITKAIRIIAPELIAGVYTPEELEDAGAVEPAKPAKKSPAERRKEIEAEEAAATVTSNPPAKISTPVAEEIIDAVVEAPQDAGSITVESSPFPEEASDDNEPVTNALLQEIVKVGSKIPSPSGSGSGMTVAEIAAGIVKACNMGKEESKHITKPQEATRGQIRKLIARFRETLGEKS